MSDKHTPGPWHYLPQQSGMHGSIECEDGRYIAWMPWMAEAHKPEMNANAQLIAAAPDLLAALERLAFRFTMPEMQGLAQRCCSSALEDATAAIAKAKGGT